MAEGVLHIFFFHTYTCVFFASRMYTFMCTARYAGSPHLDLAGVGVQQNSENSISYGKCRKWEGWAARQKKNNHCVVDFKTKLCCCGTARKTDLDHLKTDAGCSGAPTLTNSGWEKLFGKKKKSWTRLARVRVRVMYVVVIIPGASASVIIYIYNKIIINRLSALPCGRGVRDILFF